jgi:hypothetical protein
MSCVGICIHCGADLADDGGRTCDCRRSTLERVVAQAVRLSSETGRDLRAALREASGERRRVS